MQHIKIIETGIDCSGFLDELDLHKDDWKLHTEQVKQKKIFSSAHRSFGSRNITLFTGPYKKGIPEEDHKLEWYEIFNDMYYQENYYYKKTIFFDHYPSLIKMITDRFPNYMDVHQKIIISRLPPEQEVPSHQDIGRSYENHRFHISVKGRYLYKVADEEIIIDPGTFFWFNNKRRHSAVNIGDDDRITAIFDVPPSECEHLELPYNEKRYVPRT